jgi:hypothetical protein
MRPVDYVWYNNDEVVIYETTHHPYIQDGKPYGMVIQVAHNKTQNVYVKITPASGSHHEIVSEEYAKELMKDGATLFQHKQKT